jgi:hypothetical protein
MLGNYLKAHLIPSYAAVQKKHRLGPGDGLTGLNSRPIWL